MGWAWSRVTANSPVLAHHPMSRARDADWGVGFNSSWRSSARRWGPLEGGSGEADSGHRPGFSGPRGAARGTDPVRGQGLPGEGVQEPGVISRLAGLGGNAGSQTPRRRPLCTCCVAGAWPELAPLVPRPECVTGPPGPRKGRLWGRDQGLS